MPSIIGLPVDVWFVFALWMDVPTILSLSIICKALHQIFNTRVMWASIVKKLTNEHYVAPFSFPLDKMNVKELRDMATRPYSFEHRIRHPPPLPEGIPPWPQPTIRFHMEIKPLQIILRAGGASADSISRASLPPPAINTYSFHTLPGARWVLGIPRSIPNGTIDMEYRSPAARILCWDLAQLTQSDTDLLPAAWVDIGPRSDHAPKIQYNEVAKIANILIAIVPEEGYIGMSLVQLSWSNGKPMLLVHSTTPPFASQEEGASLRLDGMHALFSSRAAPGLLWNWKHDTWGRISPREPYDPLVRTFLRSTALYMSSDVRM
ncbi:hypothetical protein DL93DRAFT_957924 [Clavulina sp. PMI_390]|nr:hypothetical protein DL93DRAFT_957924 [Clavulina sp. PMI_390]